MRGKRAQKTGRFSHHTQEREIKDRLQNKDTQKNRYQVLTTQTLLAVILLRFTFDLDDGRHYSICPSIFSKKDRTASHIIYMYLQPVRSCYYFFGNIFLKLSVDTISLNDGSKPVCLPSQASPCTYGVGRTRANAENDGLIILESTGQRRRSVLGLPRCTGAPRCEALDILASARPHHSAVQNAISRGDHRVRLPPGPLEEPWPSVRRTPRADGRHEPDRLHGEATVSPGTPPTTSAPESRPDVPRFASRKYR